jgi:uncharacterized membrane protein
MSTVIKSIEVDAPVSTVFCEWTRFEELPRFMRGVIAVTPLGDRLFLWRAQIFGAELVWELDVTEIVEERRLAWASRSGPRNHGVIALEALSPGTTRVTMEIHYDPAGVLEGVSDYLGVLGRWVERSLVRFKELMEGPYSTLVRLPSADELVGH